MADHQDTGAAPEPPFGGPTPTPPPLTEQQEKSHRLRTLLTWAVLIVGLGLGLYIYARLAPDGPSDAARIKGNCQFQYPYDKARAQACIDGHGPRQLNDREAERVRALP